MREIGGLRKKSRVQLSKVLREARGGISPADASRALGIDRTEAARSLSRWHARGWLTRVRRGYYAPVPLESSTADLPIEDPWVVAARIFAPCYVGGWSAAEHWGLTEQLFRSTLVVTTRRPRSRRVKALGTSFVLRTVEKRAMFGLKPIWRGKVKVSVSDPSRTLVDMLDTPAVGGGITAVVDMLKSYFTSEHRDPNLLIHYAGQLGNRAVFKRLGFLAEMFFPKEEALVAECRKRLSGGNAKLDPKLPDGRLITAWRLWVPSGFTEGLRE